MNNLGVGGGEQERRRSGSGASRRSLYGSSTVKRPLFFVCYEDVRTDKKNEEAEEDLWKRIVFAFPCSQDPEDRNDIALLAGAVDGIASVLHQIFKDPGDHVVAQEDFFAREVTVVRLDAAAFASVHLCSFTFVFSAPHTLPDALLRKAMASVVSVITFYLGPIDQPKEANFLHRLNYAGSLVYPLLHEWVHTENPFRSLECFQQSQCSSSLYVSAEQLLHTVLMEGNDLGCCMFYERSILCSYLEESALLRSVTAFVPAFSRGKNKFLSPQPELPLLDPRDSYVPDPTRNKTLLYSMANRNEKTELIAVWISNETYHELVEQVAYYKSLTVPPPSSSPKSEPAIGKVFPPPVSLQGDTPPPPPPNSIKFAEQASNRNSKVFFGDLAKLPQCGNDGRFVGLCVHTVSRLSLATLIDLDKSDFKTVERRVLQLQLSGKRFIDVERKVRSSRAPPSPMNNSVFSKDKSLSVDVSPDDVLHDGTESVASTLGERQSHPDSPNSSVNEEYFSESLFNPMPYGGPGAGMAVNYVSCDESIQATSHLTNPFSDIAMYSYAMYERNSEGNPGAPMKRLHSQPTRLLLGSPSLCFMSRRVEGNIACGAWARKNAKSLERSEILLKDLFETDAMRFIP